MKSNKDSVFKVGIDCLREEGVVCFIRKIVKWIPHYIVWKRAMIRGWYFEHSDRHKEHCQFKYLQGKSEVDSYVRFRRIEGVLQYCQKHGQAYKILNKGEKIDVVLPKFFETKETIEKTVFDSPPIYLTTLEHVMVYGATNLISKENVAFSDIFYRDKGKNRYNVEGGSIICSQKRGKYIGVAYKNTDTVVKEAINCFGWACGNYYHLTFEILSRLAFVDEYEEYRSIPILIDAEVLNVPQMKALIEKVNIYHHPIIPIDRYHRIHVERLIYISRNMWVPPNLRPGIIERKMDFMISRSVVDNIRNRVLPIERNCENAYKKIFISRGQGYHQRLLNIEEITQIFADNGYHIIYPEKLSYEEQVMFFNGADIIVGVAGAALTNIVYCHEDAKVVEIALETHPVYSFSAITNAVKADFIILGADVVQKAKYSSLDTFVLNKNKCLRLINSLSE